MDLRQQTSGHQDVLQSGLLTLPLDELIIIHDNVKVKEVFVNSPVNSSFSERGPLLDLIYRLRTFGPDELLSVYRNSRSDTRDSDESVLDYLQQLTEIRLLKRHGDKYFLQSSLKD